MNLSCSAKAIKYLLFIFNFIFAITGIIILAVGVSVKAYFYEYDTFLDEQYFSLPNLLIATGSIIFFISFFGCCGAIKESWLMIVIFSGLLIIIFIFEFSAGIAGYALRDQTAKYLDQKLYDSMVNYFKNDETIKMWDIIQREFSCCGVRSYKDWESVFENKSLPLSCCPNKIGASGAFYCNAYIPPIPETTVSGITKLSTSSVKPLTNPENPPSTAEKNPSTAEATMPSTAASTSAKEVTKSDLKIIAQALVSNPSTVTSEVSYPPSTTSPFSLGCEDGFGKFVRAHAVDLGGVGIALAVIQLVGIIFSCHLARQLKQGYYST